MNTLLIRKANAATPEEIQGMISVSYKLTEESVNQLRESLKMGDETSVHNTLNKFPELMRDVLPGTGHHGMWFKNKPEICPPKINGEPGKIPDMLLGGKNSDGISWFLLELKSPSKNLFNDKLSFSADANLGLNQLARYLHFVTEKQTSIRDLHGLPEFKSPKGILLIGREEETLHNEIKLDHKSFWNDALRNIQIISYDRILRTAERRLKFENV